ncbi:hypothetical protein ACFOWB_19830 [Chenggangzhangella methanolivorans]|uniref:hypothetical protein n=1 Tax=Chenggangzhangella methanolivorans TaxID=1437009 RepID=UPI003609A17D
MTLKNIFTTGAAAALLAASTSFAMAQATGTENNATGGSQTDSMKMKDSSGSMKSGSSGSMEMKGEKPTSAGSSDNQAKDLRGHSETPTSGSGK